MRLYSLQKRHILIVFLCFFGSFFLALNVGFLGIIILRPNDYCIYVLLINKHTNLKRIKYAEHNLNLGRQSVQNNKFKSEFINLYFSILFLNFFIQSNPKDGTIHICDTLSEQISSEAVDNGEASHQCP